MSKNKNFGQAVKDLFATHPTVDTFFGTSDEQFFFTENSAYAHANSLEDKEVSTLERAEVESAKGKPEDNAGDDKNNNNNGAGSNTKKK